LGTYGRVAAWLSKRVEVALAQVELTLPQYRVMGILAEGTAAASALADRLAVRRPSITALIDGLVARGLVDRRQEDADRRRVSLRLTPEGTSTLARADVAVDEYLVAIAGHLPDKEEAMALRSLELWARAMVESRQGPRQTDDDSAAPDAPSRGVHG
jgi:long-chain acyl-CoA synthetase